VHSIGTWWLWTVFFIFVLLVLAIDLFCLGNPKKQRVSTRESLSWLLLWFCCAMLFNFLIGWHVARVSGIQLAHQKALEFFTGYVIEESLSVDNMFAFLMIFNYFAVPHEYQRRVLLYGVLGAIIFRLFMILFGTWLVINLHWILYVFGLFLVITGIKMLFFARDKNELKDNFILIWLQKHLRLTETFHEEKFFIKRRLLWYATPLFLVLVLIELSDVVFALDSIPAIFAVTQDPFIVFTSNIFAILGLRALYFSLAHLANRFYLLKYGVALILVFIGGKMLIEPWWKISIMIALSVVLTILGTTVFISLVSRARFKEKT